MSVESLPCGLRTREALAVRRDALAAFILRLMLNRAEAGPGTWLGALMADYQALADEIAATGEVVMGPGAWRRETVRQGRMPGVR